MSSNSSWSVIGKIVIVWLCFGMSESYNCGKFQYKNDAGNCSPCRRCPDNIDDAYTLGTIVKECKDTALTTPDWLQGAYLCQGSNDPLPKCKAWSPQNGSLSCTHGMNMETDCRLLCNKDYYPSLNESIRCTGDLEWSKSLPYCVHVNDSITTTPPPACPEWSPTNGRVSCTQSRDVGSVCTLSCNQGFNPSSNQGVTCSKELQWDRQLPLCIIEPTTTTPKPSCEPLEVINGTLYCSEDSYSGSQCSVKCNEGFTMSVNITVTCTTNLTWSDVTPSCVEIQKTTTPAPRCSDVTVGNGTVSCTNDFNVGSYCNVTCTGEFQSTSDESLYCRSNQTWNQPSPICYSPVPVESRKIPEESFPWYIIGIIVGMLVLIMIIFVIVRIKMYLKTSRNRMENNNCKKRKGSDEIELESITTLEDSDCGVCGKFCVCLLPKKKNKGESNQAIDAAGSSLDQPISAAGSSLDQPNNAAGSSLDQPNNAAGSSLDQPNNAAGSSIDQPNNAAGSSIDQPNNAAGSWSSSNQPINEEVTRKPRQISEECASAQHFGDISFDDMEKLATFFDQFSKSNNLSWKHLAVKVLGLNTIEIGNIEYKYKDSKTTGPTNRVFSLMKEQGITLFQVIQCLHGKMNHDNVVKALDILYKYCDSQEINM